MTAPTNRHSDNTAAWGTGLGGPVTSTRRDRRHPAQMARLVVGAGGLFATLGIAGGMAIEANRTAITAQGTGSSQTTPVTGATGTSSLGGSSTVPVTHTTTAGSSIGTSAGLSSAAASSVTQPVASTPSPTAHVSTRAS